MRQYPIWNIITACIYKNGTPSDHHSGSKSYGVKDTGEVEVRVGTSSSNSHTFLKHTTTHRQLENGDREYRFYIDGELFKRALLPKGKSDLVFLSTDLSIYRPLVAIGGGRLSKESEWTHPHS